MTQPLVLVVAAPLGVDIGRLRPWLDRDEIVRADAMPDARRRQFLSGRFLARRLIGAASGRRTEDVRIGRSAGGRPKVDEPGVDVSISHIDAGVAVAVAIGAQVGVDLQHPVAVSDRFLCRCLGDDAPLVAAMDAPTRLAAVADSWAVREACLKLTGDGLRRSPWRIPIPVACASGRWQGATWRLLRPARAGSALAVAMKVDGEEAAVADLTGERIRIVVLDALGRERADGGEVDESMPLGDGGLGITSLGFMRAIIALEDEFGVELDETMEAASALETVGDVVALVARRLTTPPT